MKTSVSITIALICILGLRGLAAAIPPDDLCTFPDPPRDPKYTDASVKIAVKPEQGVRLLVRLENPPRTRVTLSIDSEIGVHFELIWDPAINDGLQHELVLTQGDWTLTPSGEQERVTTQTSVVTFFASFRRSAVNKAHFDVWSNVVIAGQASTLDRGPSQTTTYTKGQDAGGKYAFTGWSPDLPAA